MQTHRNGNYGTVRKSTTAQELLNEFSVSYTFDARIAKPLGLKRFGYKTMKNGKFICSDAVYTHSERDFKILLTGWGTKQTKSWSYSAI
jgi:hypothetical protein